jgi:predicted phosphodiesterase
LEFQDYTPQRTDADVVILAGDIHDGREGIQWAKRQFPKQPVIYVMGNHEFYGRSMVPLLEECQAETQGTNIHLLENESVQVGDLTFFSGDGFHERLQVDTNFIWPAASEGHGQITSGLTGLYAGTTAKGQA